jgi:hypothetical protein
MPWITEIAILKLHVPLKDPSLRAKLANAKKVMEDFTKRRFHFCQQQEDPSIVYIFGEWESLEHHMDMFIPSKENQELLRDLKGMVSVMEMFHISAPHAELPFATDSHELLNIIGITRICGLEENRVRLAEQFDHFLLERRFDDRIQQFIPEPELNVVERYEGGWTGPMVGGGIRLDGEMGTVEYVVLTSLKTSWFEDREAPTDGNTKFMVPIDLSK